jgi:hypothetical protein
MRYLINHVSSPSFTLLISLFTGKDTQSLKQENIIKLSDSSITYRINHVLPNLGEELLEQLEITSDYFDLKLPDIFKLFDKIKYKLCKTTEVTKLKEILVAKYNVRFELSQINYYMAYWMSGKNVDTAIIGILYGDSMKEVLSVNYYLTDTNNIFRIYDEYVNHLLFKKIKSNQQLTISFENKKIGSNLVIKSESITKIFKNLSISISGLSDSNYETFFQQYNLFTIYTVFYLNLSTGYRPVKDIYDSINKIHLNSKLVYISDKARDSTLPYRLNPIPDLACTQIKNYVSYIKYLCHEMSLLAGIKDELINILNGDGPMFKLFIKGKLVSYTTKNVKTIIGDSFNINQNWNRHYMRTKLSEHEVPGRHIDMWMGHEGLGEYALSEYSSMSMNDLKFVSDKISTILKNLKVLPLKVY